MDQNSEKMFFQKYIARLLAIFVWVEIAHNFDIVVFIAMNISNITDAWYLV